MSGFLLITKTSTSSTIEQQTWSGAAQARIHNTLGTMEHLRKGVVMAKKNKLTEVTEMYAFVSCDDKSEGIWAADNGKRYIPLICSEIEIAYSYVPIADEIAKKTNSKYRIIKFNSVEDVTKLIRKGKTK